MKDIFIELTDGSVVNAAKAAIKYLESKGVEPRLEDYLTEDEDLPTSVDNIYKPLADWKYLRVEPSGHISVWDKIHSCGIIICEEDFPCLL